MVGGAGRVYGRGRMGVGDGVGIMKGGNTAVSPSMQKTSASPVIYRESASAYSFHSCPKKSCLLGRRAWLRKE